MANRIIDRLKVPTPARHTFRPKRLRIQYFDRWTDEHLLTWDTPYDPEDAARGLYSAIVKENKRGLARFHGGRIPYIKIQKVI